MGTDETNTTIGAAVIFFIGRRSCVGRPPCQDKGDGISSTLTPYSAVFSIALVLIMNTRSPRKELSNSYFQMAASYLQCPFQDGGAGWPTFTGGYSLQALSVCIVNNHFFCMTQCFTARVDYLHRGKVARAV